MLNGIPEAGCHRPHRTSGSRSGDFGPICFSQADAETNYCIQTAEKMNTSDTVSSFNKQVNTVIWGIEIFHMKPSNHLYKTSQ